MFLADNKGKVLVNNKGETLTTNANEVSLIEEMDVKGASDKPLTMNDPESEHLSRFSQALSNYMMKKETKPPLTFAVTGKWGSGKSSFMNLVESDLKFFGFRTVFFNAWHHQKEEYILASLFEALRDQGLPFSLSAPGIWFRIHLFLHRIQKMLLVAIMVSVPILLLVYFALRNQENRLLISEWFIKGIGRGQGIILETGIIGLVLSLGLYFFQQLKVFGIFLSKLSSPFQKFVKVDSFKEQVGLRYQFKKAFAEITGALGRNKIVIFIDDLDRCDPGQVVEVLNTINFLTSAGGCYFVLGMDPNWVKGCIENQYKEIVGNVIPENGDFATNYLEKMINLEVRVPPFDIKSTNDYVTVSSLKNFKKKNNQLKWSYRLKCFLLSLPFMFGVFGAGILALQFYPEIHTGVVIWQNYLNSEESEDLVAARIDVNKKESGTTPNARLNSLPDISNEKSFTLIENPGSILITTLSGFIASLIAVFFFMRLRDGIKDSPDVKQGLEIWEKVAAHQQTPRSLRKFKNKVRYYRGFLDVNASTKEGIKEFGKIRTLNLIILTAIDHFAPKLIEDTVFWGDLRHFIQGNEYSVFPPSVHLQENLQKVLKRAILEYLKLPGKNDDFKKILEDWKHFKKIRFIVG